MSEERQRRHLEDELRARTEGLAALVEAVRSLASSLVAQDVLQAAVDAVRRQAGLDTAAVYLLDGDTLDLAATTPPLPPDFPLEMRFARLADHPRIGRALHTGEPVLEPDMTAADLTPAERDVVAARSLRTVLFVPMRLREQALGVFIVGSVDAPTRVTAVQTDLTRTLAGLAALAVRNAQLYEESRAGAAALERTLAAREEAERQRQVLEGQLQQAQRMESIGRLAGGVAHDFNNMLSVILGTADYALETVGDGHPLREDLVQIREAARRSADLTRQLLAFARRQTAVPETLDLNAVIADMLRMLRRLLGENIALEWLPGDDLGAVRMDPSQVDQILANLCVNARDAITGTGRITIETANATFDEKYCATHAECVPGDYVMIAVSDDGAGMDRETLASIFEPYFSTKAAEGTGLGLSTVYGIVRQNEGFIHVYSEPGHGTTFRIYLARQRAGRATRRARAAERPAPGGGETVLLVEDEPMILALGRRMLDSLGYRVLAAGGPEEALRAAADHGSGIDLLVTDVVMPRMNGHELADRLAETIPDLRVLYVSGYTANVVADQGLLREGVALLTKPFSLSALAARVREALGTGGRN